jgi:hypothetical protein
MFLVVGMCRFGRVNFCIYNNSRNKEFVDILLLEIGKYVELYS